MNDKKVSIIVPVYKVEKYLKECLESLRKQTYENIEIILCDDGSPDNCPEICEKYAKMDARFKVLHKENGGAASARNMGMNMATGEYVGFVDSDDYVHPDYIQCLTNSMEIHHADISVCSYLNLFQNRTERVEIEKIGTYTEKEYLEQFLTDWKCGLLWNKLFKKKLLENIRFAEGHIIDDEFFTYKVVMNAKKIFVSKESLVFYRQRKSGVMNQGAREKMLIDRMQYLPERYEEVARKFPELKNIYFENLCDNIICMVREAACYEEVKRKVRKLQIHYLQSVLISDLNVKQKYAYVRAFLEKKCADQFQNQEEEKDFFD